MKNITIVEPERLESMAVADLRPHERNPRTHSKKQVEQIAASIKRFGFTNPVLVDRDGQVIAGHGRIEAAKLLGMATVPVLRLEHMTEAEKRAYVIADNRLAELAGWDNDLLALELAAVSELDSDFDLALTGFDVAEIEALLNGLESGEQQEEEPVQIDEQAPVVSRVGDMWQLGDHALICGDATDPEVYRRLLDQGKAQMVFTDPPYNVPVNGHICGLGKVQHDEFVMASGEMTEEQFTTFLRTVTSNLAAFSDDGSIHYVCMDWRHMGELLAAGRSAYAEFKNLVVWNKDNGGMGAFYRSKHELVFVFKNGSAPHINNFGLGQHGRYRTNVWDYAGVNSLKADRDEELAMHPTVKPVAMVADAIRDCSRRGGVILDAFSGSGTTIIAAEQTGRRARAIELDPRYVDVAIRRWQHLTGGKATLAGSDSTFDELSEMVAELED
ncbi:DNA methylase N-4 [Sphingopyxis terrae subsp. ummariensis]|uniref:Methyltransferase n=2 Tax=Sphingopyxis terrae TaxID=33052 RepID=A0A1Y6FN90_9SPHN|nr:DNA methylase N-4 [Sphingopyxis terrae subsp. ummariensis]SMQ76177.1 DNA modification methylase [Sphingopyxis terrae subsp. ummariensis]